MGFSLQFAPIASMIASEEDEQQLFDLLRRHNITFVDRFDPANFQDDEFFEINEFETEESLEDDSYVEHPEVGWSWWSKTQEYVSSLLGEDRSRTVANIHAWYGVAVPGDLEPTLVGPPVRRTPAARPRQGLLSRLGFGGRKVTLAAQIDSMVNAYAGDYENLHVVSGPRLLEELAAAIRTAGLEDANPLELYDEAAEEDALIAPCYLVMAHKFLKAGVDRNLLVWWRK